MTSSRLRAGDGTSPTQLAAQAGLSIAQWYQDESAAFAAGFDAEIAKNELTVPTLASHPDITTPREYRDYTVSSIKTQGADLELAIALGMNPMQMGIMPGETEAPWRSSRADPPRP